MATLKGTWHGTTLWVGNSIKIAAVAGFKGNKEWHAAFAPDFRYTIDTYPSKEAAQRNVEKMLRR